MMNKLRVWHIPQVPGKAFYVPVTTPEEGMKVLGILAEYDLFQLKYNIKPDYSNASGLQVWEDNEWLEWKNEDGDCIKEVKFPNVEKELMKIKVWERGSKWVV
jgi:hypothetical protein